jgi:opacity protein-like surface antigen
MSCQQVIATKNNSLCDLRVGVQGGYIGLDSKAYTSSMTAVKIGSSSSISGRGIIGGVVMDLGTVDPSSIYYGIEASADMVNARGKINTQAVYMEFINQVTKIRVDRAFGVSAKLGYLVNNLMLPYIKIGATWAHWKASTISIAPVSGASSSLRAGLIGGFGADFSAGERVSLGIGYNYHYYSKFTYVLKNIDDVPVRKIKVSPRASTVMFFLKVRLC